MLKKMNRLLPQFFKNPINSALWLIILNFYLVFFIWIYFWLYWVINTHIRKEARYALALNPCRIVKKRIGAKERFEARVRVEYPMKTEVTLLKYPKILKIEEGLFGYLQKSD